MIGKCVLCGETKKHVGKKMCAKCYNRERFKDKGARMRRLMWQRRYIKEKNITIAMDIVERHEEEMRNDPESLTTDFILDIMGVKEGD